LIISLANTREVLYLVKSKSMGARFWRRPD
jgi:hypothetical protein